MEFEILVEKAPEALAQRVRQYIDQGWKLKGGIRVYKTRDIPLQHPSSWYTARETNSPYHCFMQAVIRKGSKDSTPPPDSQ